MALGTLSSVENGYALFLQDVQGTEHRQRIHLYRLSDGRRAAPEFGFGNALVEQVAANPVEEAARSTAVLTGIHFGDGNLRVVVGSESIIKTLTQVGRPLWFYLARADKVQAEHPAGGRVALGGDVLDVKRGLRRMESRVVRARDGIRVASFADQDFGRAK
jgi:hypothetical protein